MAESSCVGKPINFRGLVYSPINEQGVVYLFALVAEDLNIRVESIQQGYPDCTGVRYVGKGKWKRIRIEFEHKSSNFDHDPKGCDVLVCWEDDLAEEKKKSLGNIEVIELKSVISSPEVPNKVLSDPDEPQETTDIQFDLEHHYKRSNVSEKTKKLFETINEKIMQIDTQIWRKISKTAITYYSPEKTFVYLTFRKGLMVLNIYTNQQKIEGVENIKSHENWGKTKIKNEQDLDVVVKAIRTSYDIMKKAIKENVNTGWYAITPKEKLTWLTKETEEENEER